MKVLDILNYIKWIFNKNIGVCIYINNVVCSYCNCFLIYKKIFKIIDGIKVNK